MAEVVRIEREGRFAVVRVDHPPVNALSTAVKEGLLAALAAVAADPAVEGMVLAAAGRSFMAGADLREMDRPPEPPFLPDVIAAIDAVGKPSAAALHGHVLGGGFEAALACRLRVARAGTMLGFPEVKVGLVPGASGTQRLLRHLPFAVAARLIATGRMMTAEEALALGLVDAVVSGDPVEAAMALLAERMAAGRVPPATAAMPAREPGPEDGDTLEAEIRKAARGQAAPLLALALLRETATLPWEEGLARERALFLRLRESAESRSLRRVFLAEREAGRLPALAGVPARSVATIGVVGAGLMGAGIAYAALLAGHRVIVREATAAALEGGRLRLAELMDGGFRAGRLTLERRADLEAALTLATAWEALAPADLVIEAVFEDLGLKQEVFRALERVTRPDTLLATNTSYLDLDAIAAVVADPQRVLGLHFFSPAHVMKLVEVVRGAATAPEALATGVAVARKLGKVPVVTGNGEGFCGNRILRAYRLVAEAMVEDGATPEAVDAAMRAFGFPMGPFAVQDMAGLEIALANRKRSPPILRDGRRVDVVERLVAAGRLGRKNGRGWYRYPDGAREGAPDPEVAALLAALRAEKGITPRTFAAEAIEAALITEIRREAQAIVAEGIVERLDDVMLVLIHGYGFPAHRVSVLEEGEGAP